jgi:hypothetical protein
MSEKTAAIAGAILFACLAPVTTTASAKDSQPGVRPAAVVAGHCAAWNTTERAHRDILLRRVFARDGVYSDPTPTYVTGRAALSDAIANFQRQYRGARFRCSAPQTHHRAMRVSWLLVGAYGKVVTQGMDFYELAPDGLIRRVTGFFGPPPSLAASR